jgi:uncharacterized caspase-like protein
MPPVGVGASRFASALETGVAKFWVLLIGVDRYQDLALPSLRYAAVDCQGIGAALTAATGTFPDREFLIHHDLVPETPTLARVETSLHRIVTQAQPQDTVLIYFSGHGVVEATTEQTILCLRDTDREHLLTTGLQIQVVLELLGHCAAHSQLLWLDACHSGNLNFIGTNRDRGESTGLNPVAQLLASLRHQAALSRGFYALLSCDEGQQSWEFPDLGHGVFSYYLMRGLQGEAADDRGAIDADSLYRYVYRQTVQYIDRTNQQLRLTDRQQRDRRGSEVSWCPEYSAQTPKRIVSGVGEIILGLKPQSNSVVPVRSALIVAAGADRIGPISLVPSAESLPEHSDCADDLSDEQIAAEIGHALEREGKFTLDYFPTAATSPAVAGDPAASLRQRIQSFLAEGTDTRSPLSDAPDVGSLSTIATCLLYLRGQITAGEGGDAWFVLEDGVRLSRVWLKQALQRASQIQQIIILDCPGGTAAAEWIEALKITDPDPVLATGSAPPAAQLRPCGQCIIASAAEIEDADIFARVLLETLISAPPQVGIPIASLFTRLETNLDELGIPCHFWLSGTPGSIEILPATVEVENTPQIESPPRVSESVALEITPNPDLNQLQARVATTPTGFIQSLESLLYRLVGPIAPALLKAGTAQTDRVPDPATLVQNLLPLLPERARAEFEQQVGTLLDRQSAHVEIPPVTPHPIGAERSAAKSVPSVQPLPSDAQSYFPPAARQAIAQTLKQTIGPVAEVLLGQIAPTAWTNDRSLLAALTPYMSADRLTEFAERLQPLLNSPTAASAECPAAAPHNANGRGISTEPDSRPAPAMSVDDNLKIACERELTQAIGPVAKFIIATTHKTNPQICPADFVNSLATQIPDPLQAAAFCHKMQLRSQS